MAPDSEPTPRVPWLPVNEGTPPAPPPPAEALTPTKPVVPAWIQRDAEPVEAPAAESFAPAEAVRSPFEPPEPSEPAPPDIPDVTPDLTDEPQQTHREKADALAAGIVAQEQAMLATTAQDLDGGVAYEPLAFGAATTEVIAKRGGDELTEPAASEADAEAASADADPDPDPATASGTKKRRWWLWALLAVVVLGAIGAAIAVLNKPEATIIPGVTVTEPPPSPTIIPSEAPTATTFQASMPTSVGTFALVSAVALDPADVALIAGRIADGVDLSYRSGNNTLNVRALQYYNEDDAKAMFTQFAGEGAATSPVEAGGVTVGESAQVTEPEPGMVWRNGTTVFILTGPTAQIADFYAQFGL